MIHVTNVRFTCLHVIKEGEEIGYRQNVKEQIPGMIIIIIKKCQFHLCVGPHCCSQILVSRWNVYFPLKLTNLSSILFYSIIFFDFNN